MTGTIAQLVSLVSYGNECITTRKTAVEYYPGNSTLTFCNLIDFRRFKKRFFFSKNKEVVVAKNPGEWFELLVRDECKKLRLHYQGSEVESMAPDYKLAGLVGGGGTWLIETVFNNHSDYWANRWEVTRRDDPDRKIWSVNYGQIASNQPTYNINIDLNNARRVLNTVLGEIKDFATQQELTGWVSVFDKAINTLSSDTPHLEYYHNDLIIRKKYSLMAQQTLFAAGNAWVFGGMGSWNDLGFETAEDQASYEDLSKKLYGAIIQGILAATNK